METREWTTVDKAAWGRGSWTNEPDKRQWQDETTGLPCLIVRNPRSGNWCGYVGVSRAHPLHGVGYSEGALPDFDVHGGLTFADKCDPHPEGPARGICHVPAPGEPDDVWWFGFDCAHGGDLSPGYRAMLRDLVDTSEIYRDLSYVERQCRDLAAQLHALVVP